MSHKSFISDESAGAMTGSIHARLDDETAALCEQIRQAKGWTDSEIVRRGIKLLAAVTPRSGKRRFRNAGKYDSGIPDLATNKAHMEGFGES
jgi:hypothetical protein